jgi:hypothetical protein
VKYAVLKKTPSSTRYDYSDCPGNPLCGKAAPRFVRRVYENSDYIVFRLNRLGPRLAN